MATSCGCHGREAVLDVRELPPRVRHPKIFQTFDALPPGGRFVLVNDHDPKPLFYQFQFERAGTFDWQSLEEGPHSWRVEITKRAGAAPGPVDSSQIVGELAARSPRAREVLQRFGIDHCCSASLSLAEAAAAAGLDVEVLLRTLSEAVSAPPPDTPRPAVLDGLRRVELDVCDDIRAGIEPFARIMAAVKGLGEHDVLVLRAPFEPIPLYDVLGRRGLAHWTERRAADDWLVWFSRALTAAAPRGPAGGEATREAAATVVVDVRSLEAPQPMVRVLERLDDLGPGQELRVLHDRRPLFLYPQLEARGFVHETCEPAPGRVEILIRRAPEPPAGRRG